MPDTDWNEEIGADDETGFGVVQCSECGAKIEGHDREYAEEVWNRRAPDSADVRGEAWTIIIAASDCSSVQCVTSAGRSAEDAARKAFADNDWMLGFELIAVVRGVCTVLTRDDARTAEYGLQV